MFGSSVPHTSNVEAVRSYLREKNDRGIVFRPTEEQIERINQTHREMNDLLSRYDISPPPEGWQGIRTRCSYNQPTETPSLKGDKWTSPTANDNHFAKANAARLVFINSFREVVEPCINEKEYDIIYRPTSIESGMHQHDPRSSRFYTFALDGHYATEYPGLFKNKATPRNNMLCFGGDFWHSSPQAANPEERPFIVAQSPSLQQ